MGLGCGEGEVHRHERRCICVCLCVCVRVCVCVCVCIIYYMYASHKHTHYNIIVVVWWIMWGSAPVQRWVGESEDGDWVNAVGPLVEDDRQRSQSKFCYIPKLTFYWKYDDHVFILGRVVQYWYGDVACSPPLAPAERPRIPGPSPAAGTQPRLETQTSCTHTTHSVRPSSARECYVLCFAD